MENNNSIKSIVGVDVGGTKIEAGRIVNNQIVEKHKVDTEAHLSQEEVIGNVCKAIEKVVDHTTYSIGVGVPGFVDIDNGIVRAVTNIPSWKNVPLQQELEEYFSIPVNINNDANCFAIGEKYYGKAKNFKSFVGITLGTGLGSGVIINEKLFTGSHNGSGEFGSIPYLGSNYEYYCSSSFFKNVYKTTGAEVYQNALRNDVFSLNIMSEFGRHIGNTIKTIMLSIDPEAVVIGGSIAGSFDLFKESMWETIRTFPNKEVTDSLKVEKSELESAILGAAALTFQYADKNETAKIANS